MNTIKWAVSRSLLFHEKINDEWKRGANRRTLFILLLIGSIFLYTYLELVAPPTSFPLGELVEVKEAVTLDDLALQLERQFVVKDSLMFKLTVMGLGRSTAVRAGDYVFKEPVSVFAVARAITTGAYGLEPERIRVNEGATVREIAKMLATRFKRIDEERFIEKAEPLEGYLFPDTYFFLPNVNEDTVIRAMRQNFDAQIEKVMGEIASFGKPLPDVVIMASLLEREARRMDDRRMISGVLWRRISKDMLLQVDAAFLYSIGRTTFDLTTTDLKNPDDPYNTYVHKGLPPGPIGNPSLSSLKAAVTPIDQGYLFYLADRSNVTHYSKTYEQHLEKKRLYLGT